MTIAEAIAIMEASPEVYPEWLRDWSTAVLSLPAQRTIIALVKAVEAVEHYRWCDAWCAVGGRWCLREHGPCTCDRQARQRAYFK